VGEPRSSRPRFPPGYGITRDAGGQLPWVRASERLAEGRSYWICTVRPDGSPHAMPVWGIWIEETLWFSSSPDSRKARNLRRDPRVSVHLDSGDDVVLLEGVVEASQIDARLADAYQAKYGFRPDPDDPNGLWFSLRPRVAYAWLERDYPETATRYEWG
jgi:PPOX class probable F420-dependent enzyme